MGEVAVKIKVEESGIEDEIAKQLKQVLVDHPGNKGDLNEPLEESLEAERFSLAKLDKLLLQAPHSRTEIEDDV